MSAARASSEGLPVAGIEMPTADLPGPCVCTWVVARGQGRSAVSRLKHGTTACPLWRAHLRAAEQARLDLFAGLSR